MKAKALSEQLDDVELWNREDASELERPTQPKKYRITSFAKVRSAATNSKSEVLQAAKDLFEDASFTSSIESTTKSVENYRTRFTKYQKMLHDTLGINLPLLEIANQAR